MKNLLIITLLLGSFSALGQSHTVKGFINGVNPGDTVFMGAYSGKSLQYNDTTVAAADGWFSFQGKTKEKAGKHVVFILKPSVKMVEVLLDEKDLVFKTDTSNMDLNMKVVKSETNKIFYDYKKFIHGKNLERTPLDKACGDTLLTEEQRKPSCDKIRKLTEEVIAEQTRIADEHYDLLIGKYLKMGLEVEVPEAPKNEENAQVWRYQYYRAHYWDNTDLNDPAIFREQQFHKLFEKYFKKVVPQNPDSVFNAGVEFLNKIQGKEDLFKYSLGQLAYLTESSKVMCMDKAFVLFVNRYYRTGIVDWMDDERMKKIIDGADKKIPCLCGEVASNIILPDENDVWQNMHSIPEKYTVLVFWEPSCGHCKKEMPKLKEVYDTWNSKGLEVYAVCHDLENEKWIEFIKEKELDWINVSFNEAIMDQDSATQLVRKKITTLSSLNYGPIYDISSTPQIYLLDENKAILYKQLTSEQLGGMMENLLGEKTEEKTEVEEVPEEGMNDGATITEDDKLSNMSAKELKKFNKQQAKLEKKAKKAQEKLQKKKLKAEEKKRKAEEKAAK